MLPKDPVISSCGSKLGLWLLGVPVFGLIGISSMNYTSKAAMRSRRGPQRKCGAAAKLAV